MCAILKTQRGGTVQWQSKTDFLITTKAHRQSELKTEAKTKANAVKVPL